MKERKFVGSGWENKYGISMAIKKDELVNLDVDNWGNIRLYVGKRKEPDGKSKATHYVAVEVKREARPWELVDKNGNLPEPKGVKKDLPF